MGKNGGEWCEGGREGGWEGGKEGGREGGCRVGGEKEREVGREGRREGGRKGRSEGVSEECVSGGGRGGGRGVKKGKCGYQRDQEGQLKQYCISSQLYTRARTLTAISAWNLLKVCLLISAEERESPMSVWSWDRDWVVFSIQLSIYMYICT